jgi:molecular chaperone GrpE (heat shock protein)
MKQSVTELEEELKELIIQNLKSTSILKNEVESKENEKHDLIKNVSLNIIDIIDSCENIDEWVIDNEYNEVDEARKTNSRYKTIQRRLLTLLQTQGISKIEFPDNRLIVGLCEVIETEADRNRKNDEIISIIRNGYIRGKELIRPAQIIVVKN